jgi:hypothetical protein
MADTAGAIVAIHQPNFFPWLGYFSKIARSDVFVFLDDVQFERSSSGTWSNRVRLLVGGRDAWFTVPVKRPHGAVQRVDDVRIDAAQDWVGRFLKTVRTNYSRAPYFDAVFPIIERLCTAAGDRLADFNRTAVLTLWRELGLRSPRFVNASELHVTSSATDRLVDLVKAVGGSAYLVGGGAGGYQQDDRFARAGVRVMYQDFVHPEYPQRGTAAFVPGLSCIDALCQCGFAGTAALLGQGLAV